MLLCYRIACISFCNKRVCNEKGALSALDTVHARTAPKSHRGTALQNPEQASPSTGQAQRVFRTAGVLEFSSRGTAEAAHWAGSRTPHPPLSPVHVGARLSPCAPGGTGFPARVPCGQSPLEVCVLLGRRVFDSCVGYVDPLGTWPRGLGALINAGGALVPAETVVPLSPSCLSKPFGVGLRG